MMLIGSAKYRAVMWDGIIQIGSSFHPLQKKPQIGNNKRVLLYTATFMLQILTYSSVKYAVMLLPLSPVLCATMSLAPGARNVRQTTTSHHVNLIWVIILSCSSGRLQQKSHYSFKNCTETVSSFLCSTTSASYNRLIETSKPVRWQLLQISRKHNRDKE